MRKYFLLIVFSLPAMVLAQSNPRTYPGGMLDRSMTGQYQGNKSKKGEKVDMIERAMKSLNEELNLDAFQDAVIRKLLKENEIEQNSILEEDIPTESKIEKISVLRLKNQEKIKEILRPDQIAVFETMSKKNGKKK